MEFLKAVEIKNRICKTYMKECCKECPLSARARGSFVMCSDYMDKFSEQAVKILEAWDKEHPIKTRLTDFMEKYPNAKLKTDGMPKLCPYVLGYCKELCYGEDGCAKCWNRPIENVEE